MLDEAARKARKPKVRDTRQDEVTASSDGDRYQHQHRSVYRNQLRTLLLQVIDLDNIRRTKPLVKTDPHI